MIDSTKVHSPTAAQKRDVGHVSAIEVNFDGLVGPTHNYSGLSFGNIASTSNQGLISSPRRAALQGLEKMKFLYDLGIKQAILPPQPRPALDLLRNFYLKPWLTVKHEPVSADLNDEGLVAATYKLNPQLLSAFSSASCMWTANAATVSPSADTADGRLHLTVANLASGLHRSIEAGFTYSVLKQIFSDADRFAVHEAIDSRHGDEGAANHCRLAASHGASGIELFVYGATKDLTPTKFPARQSLTASMLVAEQHQLNPDKCIFVQQNPVAIDAGVFHNDVISVSNANVFIYHEDAFVDTERVISILKEKYASGDLHLLKASRSDLSLEDAVKSYIYNSQLLSLANGEMLLVAPLEARENPNAYKYIHKIIAADNPVMRVEFLDLRESMRNGGGPACLRLRVVMSEPEMAAMKQSVVLTDSLYKELKEFISQSYREELSPQDLGDIKFINESIEVCSGLYEILGLIKV